MKEHFAACGMTHGNKELGFSGVEGNLRNDSTFRPLERRLGLMFGDLVNENGLIAT